MKYIIARGEEEDANVLRWHPESQIMVEMKPEQFLNLTPELRLMTGNLKMHVVKYLQKRLIEGLSIDIPFLDVNIKLCEVQNHEGRHRAYASKMIGLNKIPVVIYLREGFKYINKKDIDVFKICKRIKSQKCSIRSYYNYEKIDTFLMIK
mgnify:CR=1 FL=1